MPTSTETYFDRSLAHSSASSIRAAFEDYNQAFSTLTQRARVRFENRDWDGGQRDAVERIELYDRFVARSAEQIEQLLGRDLFDRRIWKATKTVFAKLVRDQADSELAKTYYSSVTRRVFDTIGVDFEIEFSGDEMAPLTNIDAPPACRNYAHDGCLEDVFRRVLESYEWSIPYVDLDQSAALIADEVTRHYKKVQDRDSVLCVDFLETVFYRDTRAYLIGKITGWTRITPIVIALKSTPEGICVDAVIQSDRGVTRLFGFARSYFHADVDPVGAAIVFLRRLMPRRPINELFTVLGRAKQGKTERYRDLSSHLNHSRDDFIFAPGVKGMVMLVFTLPSYDVVFKVIRDEFPPPKETSRERVMAQYDFVLRHHKAGRLVDTQEFRMLKFHRSRFSPDLLEELLSQTSRTTRLEGDYVVIGHAYVERRLRPLNLYLREVSPESARRAVLDYGAAIWDLAETNIFPGDLLLKNFGVSYHGRVMFYDYDELCPLTDCNFREMPTPSTHEEEMSAEPWYHVGVNDIFPEEFGSFLGFGGELRELFLEHHQRLLSASAWRKLQDRIRAGETIEALPY